MGQNADVSNQIAQFTAERDMEQSRFRQALARIEELEREVRRNQELIGAVGRFYDAMVKIGHHTPNEEISGLQSDRYPPEVDLLQAYEKWKGGRA